MEEEQPIGTIATPEMELEIKKKEYITKIKVIALDSLGKNPLTNGSTLSNKDKDKLISKMEEFLTLPESEINNLFNEICTDKLFNQTSDYTNYPVYEN